MQLQFLALSAAAIGVVGLSTVADRRRLKRADPDRVGIMPWPGILMIATLVAIVSAALALKG